MHVAEAGAGPLVVLCHGFPESWYSWRHQLAALAEAGFHAVAPDMRGYGHTDRPEAIDAYTLLHLVGDMVGLLDGLGEASAVIAGHDYRNIDRNWELLAPFAGARVQVPALYIVGDRDSVIAYRGMEQLLPNPSKFVPNLRQTLMLPGCGHWTQQERPQEVTAAILEFLKSL